MLVARDKVALEQLAVEVRAEGVQAKVVVEDFSKEGAVFRVVDKVPVSRNLHTGIIFTSYTLRFDKSYILHIQLSQLL